jgi:hypothetical protein
MFLEKGGNYTLKVKSCKMRVSSFEKNWILELYTTLLGFINFRFTMPGYKTFLNDNSQSRDIFSRLSIIEPQDHYNCKSTSTDKVLRYSRKFATLYGSIFKSRMPLVMCRKKQNESTLMPYRLWKPFALTRKHCEKSNLCLLYPLFSPGFVWRCRLLLQKVSSMISFN